MTETAASILLWGAASIAFLHTLIGVDHYLPFIVIGKARRWRTRKTLSFTALCGVGHVTGSVLLGLIGVALGLAVQKLEFVESVRGSVAAWGLIAFGLIYAGGSLLRNARGHRHAHVHSHADGTLHSHEHSHEKQHAHAHVAGDTQGLTKWTLFVLFVFGPCEALIPMFMVPAYEHNWSLVVSVAVVFSTVTIATMISAVAVGLYGFSFLPLRLIDRHANVLAGLAIAGSGLGIQLLGL